MANSTSANLKLTVQATGENSGTWGQITNTNLLILEQAIGGYQANTVTLFASGSTGDNPWQDKVLSVSDKRKKPSDECISIWTVLCPIALPILRELAGLRHLLF